MLKLKIVSPQKIEFEGEVENVKVPGSLGQFEILTGHAPIISLLTKGEVIYTCADGKHSLAIGGEELLGEDNILSMREKLIRQYENCLHDVLQFLENKYSDTITLQRVKLSIEFLRKEMVT